MTGNSIARFAIMIGLIAVFGDAHAESAYVTDRLQLGVHLQADTSDNPFTKLKSGERVDILEENRFHAKVSLPDGRTGWVKKTYLVRDKPAVLRLSEVERERDQALEKLASLSDSLSERENRVNEMEARITSRVAAVAKQADELELLKKENADMSDRLEAYGFNVPIKVFFVATLACLVIGFLVSWWWLDRRSRIRHGGYRIY